MSLSWRDSIVTAGQARIGFYSVAAAGQRIYFDDVSFSKQIDVSQQSQ